MLNPEIQKKLIAEGRNFMKSFSTSPYDNFVSDQQLKLPQPPLVKAPMAEQALPLPRNFEDLDLQQDFIALLTERRSSRVYTYPTAHQPAAAFLHALGYQGIKDIRGKSDATLRTVPSGRARHGFETYCCRSATWKACSREPTTICPWLTSSNSCMRWKIYLPRYPSPSKGKVGLPKPVWSFIGVFCPIAANGVMVFGRTGLP